MDTLLSSSTNSRSQVLPSDLNDVLKKVMKIVNSITDKALQTRLLRIVCKNIGSLHHNHTEVRWLFKGKVSTRVLQLKGELFLENDKSEYGVYFCDSVWFMKLAFLIDIFSHLNNLTLSRKLFFPWKSNLLFMSIYSNSCVEP